VTQVSFYLRQLLHQMWFLPAVFSAVALLTITGAFLLAQWTPEELPFTVSREAVLTILQIMATSLLTVTVFALSTLVGAISAASSATSPRAVPLIVADRAAQTSISIFIGAFMFSILAILGLSAGIYGSASRMLLFSVTLLVVALVIVALIRWIAQISVIGRVDHAIDMVEAATTRAMEALDKHVLFDCRALDGEATGEPVWATRLGYVQHFDAPRLQKLAEEHGLQIVVTAQPGTSVSPQRPLMLVQGEASDAVTAELVAAFVVEDQRSFENDPRFGLVVLAEIADRALSPGVNDPGTAVYVIGAATRLLARWRPGENQDTVVNERIAVPPLRPEELLEAAFRPIARDAAGIIEVVLPLLAALQTIADSNPFLRDAALGAAQDAAGRARRTLAAPADLRALELASRFASPGR